MTRPERRRDDFGVNSHQLLGESRGGELADWIEQLRGSHQECVACGDGFVVDADTELWGFPHGDGIEDGDEDVWWVYLLCPACEFEITCDMLDR